MKQTWWKEVFDKNYISAFSDFYGPARTKGEVGFVIKALGLRKGDSVLDLACGFGRHSLELDRRGMSVTGVDASPDLIRHAKSLAKKASSRARFELGDMRTYDARETFDNVVILGNSFGYFKSADNEKVLAKARAALKPGGKVLIDLPNSLGLIGDDRASTRFDTPTGYVLTENLGYNGATSTLAIKWTIEVNRVKAVHRGRIMLYRKQEIESLLRKHGLRPIMSHGSFAGDRYSLHSPRLIVTAKKVK